MEIEIDADVEAWCREKVAKGDFESLDQMFEWLAVSFQSQIGEDGFEPGELNRLVEEGLASLEAGRTVSLEEFETRLEKLRQTAERKPA